MSSSSTIDRHMQYIWGVRYIDELLMRRQNSNFSNDSPNITYDDKWYHCTDAPPGGFSTVAVLDDTAEVIERVYYDGYGQARVCPREDVEGDGDVDSADANFVNNANEGQSPIQPRINLAPGRPVRSKCSVIAPRGVMRTRRWRIDPRRRHRTRSVSS